LDSFQEIHSCLFKIKTGFMRLFQELNFYKSYEISFQIL